MLEYKLGTLESSEALIKDLYIDLRTKVNAWSEITKQTPQARMGYIGQHLVSVVTGYPGGKSGARGYDLILNNNAYGEIKTCYRVDQLGSCKKCGAVVSSLESRCSSCHSTDINRKDDSKWLISLRNETEFEEVIEPARYYFVLFEFEDITDSNNNDIIASIWEVNPLTRGFAFCMVDYYINIRAKSKSKAPFNMWPYEFKFALTKPKLIYRSKITVDGNIYTSIFPTLNNGYFDELKPLYEYSRANTVTEEAVKSVVKKYDDQIDLSMCNKLESLQTLQSLRVRNNIPNSELCDSFADAIYLPLIHDKKAQIPQKIKNHYRELSK